MYANCQQTKLCSITGKRKYDRANIQFSGTTIIMKHKSIRTVEREITAGSGK
jgi:hypothetical protein